jgi:3-deoxy-7-phosphoheptulonate synthase
MSRVSLSVVAKDAPLYSLGFRAEHTEIKIGQEVIGGKKVQLMAGPCSVESRDLLGEIAKAVKSAGANFLRGGAFKPRTSPYSFQGHKEDGLKMLASVRRESGLPVVTELMDPRDAVLLGLYADIIQIGTRNMQNYPLLVEVGRLGKPVILKRGMSSSIEELLLAAEYILHEGNDQVILCERGIRTFGAATPAVVDVGAIALLKQLTHLPVIVDPSHAAGEATLVPALARAAIAAGADGLLVEVHPRPKEALCDGKHALLLEEFAYLAKECAAIARALGREMDIY